MKIVEILPPLSSQSKTCSYEVKRIAPVNPSEWKALIRISGSHYLYKKDGKAYPVPCHGTKELGKGIEMKIKKEMGLK